MHLLSKIIFAVLWLVFIYNLSFKKNKHMKSLKWLLIVLCTLAITKNTHAQEVHRTSVIEIQSSFPIYGLSAKYAFTESSLGQVTLAPFGNSCI